ncbi:MAG TPA: sodium:solute symporter [Gemmatimonadales bacterium]|nr:sodium:solute symporter [Gemmatimonadales bacterium]
MSTLDLVVILLYFALTLGIGLWATRRQSTAGDYFLGARNLPAWAVLLSIVATETSAITVVSVPTIGARGDLGFLQLAFGYLLGRIVVAAWLLPGYFSGDQETAYSRLETRFGPGTRRLISLVFVVTRFLGDGVRIFVGALPLAVLTGWSVPTSILAMGLITLVYTWFGGLKAVVWADVVQLVVYVAGGVAALIIAWNLAGGAGPALHAAQAAGKLHLINLHINLSDTYTLLGGLVGGAMLSAASHGTDQLIVQRLLATRNLGAARVALIGSGVVVILQFLLFLLVGSAIWAAGLAPASMGDEIFPSFIVHQLPAGLAGLVIAGILAAAMSTISSSINALASSMTQDLYATWTGRTEPNHLFRVGRVFSAIWGLALVGGGLFFYAYAGGSNTPAVVLALSIASVTYGALLGTFILATRWARAQSRDVVAAVVITVPAMLLVVFARQLATVGGFGWLAPLGRLAWPWYVPLGTAVAVLIGIIVSLVPRSAERTRPA